MSNPFFIDKNGHFKNTQICVPLTSSSIESLKKEAELSYLAAPDLIEWRVDKFGLHDKKEMDRTIQLLKQVLKEIPILFTWRTNLEGGEFIEPSKYEEILKWAIGSSMFDFIDIELSSGELLCKNLIQIAKEKKVGSIISYHNFNETPNKTYLINKFECMKNTEATAAKIAVMPNTQLDVLNLMMANLEFKKINPDIVTIAISMGELGKISRISSDFFGSSLTFAIVGESSAPGQLSVNQVREAFSILNSSNYPKTSEE